MRKRNWLIGGLAAGVLVIASGFSSCNYGSGLLPIYGPVVLNPTSVSFSCPSTGVFTASQSNFTGTFSAVSNNTSIATVMPTSPPGTFVVSAASMTGSTTVTVTGGFGTTADENVTVTGLCVCVRHRDMWHGH